MTGPHGIVVAGLCAPLPAAPAAFAQAPADAAAMQAFEAGRRDRCPVEG